MLILYLLTFASGIAALVYQVVWTRLLQHVFGITVYALAAVIMTFLGGLGLGAWLLGPWADRSRNPLRLYGKLELCVALAALVGTAALPAIEPAEVWVTRRTSHDSVALVLVRVVLAAAVMLPATVFMGAALPALVRAAVTRFEQLGRRLSLIYAINTFGAFAGCLISGFFMVRAVGLHASIAAAAAINVAVAVAAVYWSRVRTVAPPTGQASFGEERVTAEAAMHAGVTRAPVGLLLAVALSSFAALALEVFWTRMLILVVGTSAYAYVTVLSAFLFGLLVGNLLAWPVIALADDARRAYGWTQLAVAAATLATLPLAALIGAGEAQRWLAERTSDWLAFAVARFGLSFALVAVPTMLLGVSLPIAARLAARTLRGFGRRLGAVHAASAVGNILGVLTASFVLVPAIGLQRGVVLCAVASLASAAWGFWPAGAPGRAWLYALKAAAVTTLLVAATALAAVWRPSPMLSAVEREAYDIVYYDEGLVDTVMVLEDRNDRRQRLMVVDGVTIANSVARLDEKQQVLAHLPFLLAADRPPQRVLAVGLGSGILVGEVVRHAGVRQVDCVELSPSVIAAARAFDAFHGAVLDDEKVRIVEDDALHFLRRSEETYDAIMSDGKSANTHAGNAVFYSLDYYRLCLERLAADGCFVQWAPLDVPHAELAVISRTVAEAFPHAYLWVVPPYSSYFVATREPLTLDHDAIERVLASAACDHLRRYGWSSAYDVAATRAGDRSRLARWPYGPAALNTLAHPVLEYYAIGDYAMPSADRLAQNLSAVVRLLAKPPRDATMVGFNEARLEACRVAVDELVRAAMRFLRDDAASFRLAIDRVELASRAAPELGLVKYFGASACVAQGQACQARRATADARGYFERALVIDPKNPAARLGLAEALVELQRFEHAETEFLRVLEIAHDDRRAHAGLAALYERQGKNVLARDHRRKAERVASEVDTERDR